MVSEEQLLEWERLANAATEGPWDACETRDYSEIRIADARGPLALVGSKHKDAAFIATARDAVPQLIAEVRRLQDENDKFYTTMMQENNKVAKLEAERVEYGQRCYQLERQIRWLSEKLYSLAGCSHMYGAAGECLEEKPCYQCWADLARRETRK